MTENFSHYANDWPFQSLREMTESFIMRNDWFHRLTVTYTCAVHLYFMQSNWHVYISTYFQNVNKPSTLHSSLQKSSWLLKTV